MKQTLLIITALMLVVGFTSGQEPIDGSTLVSKDSLQYAPGSDKPYSGEAVWYHENGQKSEVTSYKNGKQDGLYTGWYENGQKYFEGTYKDGEYDGLYTSWYENGQKKVEETWKVGKKNGLSTSWYSDGKKNREVSYKDGELIDSICWDEDGNECECDDWGSCK